MSAIYDQIGTGYSATRRADPRIVARLVTLLDLPHGSRILDVGAGTGSYSRPLVERGFAMTALEPSAVMRDQATTDAGVAWVTGAAESLPFDDGSFDGAILILCIHHFSDLAAAASEVCRVVATGPIVIFSYDPEAVESPWLFDYFPAFRDQIRASFPSLEIVRGHFSGRAVHATPFPLPHDLADDFAGAAWRYPERYLVQEFRDGTSAFRRLDPSLCKEGLDALKRDLHSGTWDARHGAVRSLQEYDHGYTFITIRGVVAGDR